jgi:hypothetical protein
MKLMNIWHALIGAPRRSRNDDVDEIVDRRKEEAIDATRRAMEAAACERRSFRMLEDVVDIVRGNGHHHEHRKSSKH